MGVLPAAAAARVSGAAAKARQYWHLAAQYRPRRFYFRPARYLPAAAPGGNRRGVPLLADHRPMGELHSGIHVARPPALSRAPVRACGAVVLALSCAASL